MKEEPIWRYTDRWVGDCRSALVTALGLIEQTQHHNTDLVNGVKALIKGFDKTLGSFLKFLMHKYRVYWNPLSELKGSAKKLFVHNTKAATGNSYLTFHFYKRQHTKGNRASQKCQSMTLLWARLQARLLHFGNRISTVHLRSFAWLLPNSCPNFEITDSWDWQSKAQEH